MHVQCRTRSRRFAAFLLFVLSLTFAIPTLLSAQEPDAPIGLKSVTTELTTSPTEPIKRDGNKRYFNYGGQTVALVGISGETIPHLILTGNYPPDPNAPTKPSTNPRSSYCVFNFLPGSTTKRKYQECLDKMAADGLNLLRLWVSFNQKPTPVSGPNHHPFKYYDGTNGAVCPNNPARTGWNLEEKNTNFFANLRQVVSEAQNRGVIVEVTLFVPNDDNMDAMGGPWWSTNNCQRKGFHNPSTFAEDAASYFHQADNSTNNPFTAANLDQNPDNQYMRNTEIRVMQWLVDELFPFNNVYFELANEPDLGGTSLGSLPPLINWHHYMARRLYDYETAKGGGARRHLIAANVSVKNVIEALLTNPKIDIVSSHYVKLIGTRPPGITEDRRHSAIKLLNNYNGYASDGSQNSNNAAIWGFNETHITGLPGDPDDPDNPFKAIPDSTRAEAWQFMTDGGGQYDHLSYCWGNAASISGAQGDCPTTGADDPDSLAARRQLGYLSRFLGTLPLTSMHRSKSDQASFWLNTPDRDETGCDITGSNFCWAAMEGGVRVAYFHHSGISPNGAFRRYQPIKRSCYRENITVKNLGNFGACTTATFKAEWFTPDGTYKDAAGNLTPIPGATFPFNVTGSGQQVALPASPCHAYDLVLKVTQTAISNSTCVPPVPRFTFTCSGLSCSFDASGSTDDQGIASYSWSFGDSTSGSGVTTSHTFPNTGAYAVALTVTDTSGLQASTSKKVSVTNEIPVAAESFFTVPPCRIADTQATTPLTNGVQRTFQVAGLCGIPASAKAVSFNVTVVSPTGSGHLIFFPGNQTSGPFTHATINFDPANSPRANNAILRLATNGAGSINLLPGVAASPGQVHVILDVYGYFSEDAAPAPGAQGPFGFQTLTPCRIADTRTGAPIAANTSRNFTVQGVCGVPAGAAAAPLNLTVIGPTAGGQATLYQTGPLPPVSTISFNAGAVLTNGARIRLAPATPDVSVNYFSPGGSSTHAVIDVYGYFKTDAPLKYRPITPCRAVDTRFTDQGGPILGAPGNRNFQIRGNCGVPLGAKAVAVNITTVNAAGGGYLAAYPSSIALPLASYLTFDPGQGALGNGGIVALSTLPDDLAVTTANSTHVIIDVFGYFQ
ncbi:MAG: PKD domain-containing protein [Acidobacteriota bacterium]